MRQEVIKGHDVAVVLALAILEGDPSVATYNSIGRTLGLSPRACRSSVARMGKSGLILRGSLRPNRHEISRFLEYGLRTTFPPTKTGMTTGVPTAYSGPSLCEMFDFVTPLVWSSDLGQTRGEGLVPLYPTAPTLSITAPNIYDALTMVDAIRSGQIREINAANEMLGVLLRTRS